MSKYYSLDKIKSKKARYNIIFGERSNGKTYASLKEGLSNYIKSGKQMAYIRRYSEDFTGKRGVTLFAGLVANNIISNLTKNEWSDVTYYASKWYLCRYEEDKIIKDKKPFCFGFAISAQEHDKSTQYPDVTTIVFDEFLSRTGYLTDEFVLYMNTLSTIIRDRNDVTIYMLGNTVNKFCPYFSEMGLKHIRDMKQGDIDVYQYGQSNLTVAVEYAKPSSASKDSDVYFAFDNPKLKMITGGDWEIDIYPHAPTKIKPKDIVYSFFIIFDGTTLQGDVVAQGRSNYIYIHLKTTPIQNPDHDLIYTTEYDPRPNYRRIITSPVDNIDKRIASYFKADKVFFQDNEVGEIVRNYLMWCNG